MNFCQECESILYLYINDDKSLFEKCKNCGAKSEIEKNSLCVYSNDINKSSQNITYDIANNKYVIKDPTLPRLNNIKCINPKCLANTGKNALLVFNKENLDVEKLINIIGEYNNKGLKLDYKIQKLDTEMNDYSEIHTLNDEFYEYKNIREKADLIVFDFDITPLIEKLPDDNLVDSHPELIIDKENGDVIVKRIANQVVFLKYDDKNMKYMYICCTCGTSWKNIH